jgi:hypothetical protein
MLDGSADGRMPFPDNVSRPRNPHLHPTASAHPPNQAGIKPACGHQK